MKRLKLLFTAALLFFTFNNFAQANSTTHQIEDLTEEKIELNDELVKVQKKLRKNRIVKGVGIGLTSASLFVWPAALPGIPMWVASPTKKWVRKEEKIQDRIAEVNKEIKALERG